MTPFLSIQPCIILSFCYCWIWRLWSVHILINTISVSSTNTENQTERKQERERARERAKDIKFLLEPPPDSHLTHCLSFMKPTLISSLATAFYKLGMWNTQVLHFSMLLNSNLSRAREYLWSQFLSIFFWLLSSAKLQLYPLGWAWVTNPCHTVHQAHIK